jgi:hypothetical protein
MSLLTPLPGGGGSDLSQQLTLFLLGNRCPPTLMAEWYVKRGMLKDKSARDQARLHATFASVLLGRK